MTIPFLEVSLNRIFECGQAYVALSRATSLEGLILKHFKAQCIRAHPQVKQFYQAIKSGQLDQDQSDTCHVTLEHFTQLFNVDGPPEIEKDDDAWIDAKPRDALKLPPSGRSKAPESVKKPFIPPSFVSSEFTQQQSSPLPQNLNSMLITPSSSQQIVPSSSGSNNAGSQSSAILTSSPSIETAVTPKPTESNISDDLRR